MPKTYKTSLVNVIVVTHDNEDTINKCIKSIISSSHFCKIVVVDNNSSDKTLKKVSKLLRKRDKIIKNRKNFGFSKAVNQAIDVTKGDVLLLNPDAFVENETISILVKVAYESDRVGAVAPRIVNPNGTLQPNSGNFPNIFNIIFEKCRIISRYTKCGYLIRNMKFYKEKQSTDWVSGTCMFIKRFALNEVGKFDERYFMYMEEVDWCFRVKAKGFEIKMSPRSKATHTDEGKTAQKYPNKYLNMRIGVIRYFSKHNKKLDLLLYKYMLKIEILFRRFTSSKGNAWEKIYNKLLKHT